MDPESRGVTIKLRNLLFGMRMPAEHHDDGELNEPAPHVIIGERLSQRARFDSIEHGSILMPQMATHRADDAHLLVSGTTIYVSHSK